MRNYGTYNWELNFAIAGLFQTQKKSGVEWGRIDFFSFETIGFLETRGAWYQSYELPANST